MKLALLLLSCLVGLSCQQSYGLWPSPMGHRAAIYRHPDQFYLPYAPHSFDAPDSLIQSRASAKSNSHHPMIFYGTLLSGDRETTVTSTVTSTVTTVVYQSCIQSEYLQTAAPCPFRREILDDETISPSQIEKVAASVEPKMSEMRSDEQPEIFSSLQPIQDPNFNSYYLHQQRLYDYRDYTVTSTKIIYAATTIKIPLFPQPPMVDGKMCSNADGNGIPDPLCPPCLPNRFVIC